MLVVNSDGTFEIDTTNRLTSVGGEARPHFDAMAAHARDIREDGRGREERRTRFARSELHRLTCEFDFTPAAKLLFLLSVCISDHPNKMNSTASRRFSYSCVYGPPLESGKLGPPHVAVAVL